MSAGWMMSTINQSKFRSADDTLQLTLHSGASQTPFDDNFQIYRNRLAVNGIDMRHVSSGKSPRRLELTSSTVIKTDASSLSSDNESKFISFFHRVTLATIVKHIIDCYSGWQKLISYSPDPSVNFIHSLILFAIPPAHTFPLKCASY